MSTRRRGLKYRYLTERDGTLYYQRTLGGRRIRFSLETEDWGRAAELRDLYEAQNGVRHGARIPVRIPVPSFAEMAERYVAKGMTKLAPTVQEDRTSHLRPDRPLVQRLGAKPLDAISQADLLDWWADEVQGRGRATSTGLNHLGAISAVFRYAMRRQIISANPCQGLREVLREDRRTKGGRAASTRSDHIRPIGDPDELRAFVEASTALAEDTMRRSGRRIAPEAHVVDLLLLDAGLRLGEALGLRWKDIEFGEDANDTSRRLRIENAIARGKYEGVPKSGRSREVQLSRRLRHALQRYYIAVARPAGEQRLFPGLDPTNYRRRHFDKVCTRAAEILRRAHRMPWRPKDLRDTFASQLLTAGIPLDYIKRQLGHSSVTTTEAHYARWCSREAYREPMHLEPGEVPADLLTRLVDESRSRGASIPS